MKVSVIVPYAQEFPQIAFTLRSLHEELRDVDHEIIAIDNMCPELVEQISNLEKKTGRMIDVDRAHARVETTARRFYAPGFVPDEQDIRQEHEGHIAAQARRLSWLKYVHYDGKLSHWQAKNHGIGHSDGDLLLFIDAHCVPARGGLSGMVRAYPQLEARHGLCSLHAPLTYHILEEHRMIYKLVARPERGELHYSFTGYRDEPQPYEVPCMSTCGMLVSRKLYNKLGGWPVGLGIYGGGENFWNYVMAVMGAKKFIMPGAPLHHHGDKRGYHWNWGDHKRNQAIASYCYGGEKWLKRFCLKHPKYQSVPDFFKFVVENVMETCATHRAHIEKKSVMTIEEWLDGQE